MSARVWTCQRVQGGQPCRHKNPSRKRLCEQCGKAKPARKRPAHMVALDLDYAGFVTLNGGDHCAICGRAPSAKRRLDRDHCHATGRPRGLLCARCNRQLPSWVTAEWLIGAAVYLDAGATARVADALAAVAEEAGRRVGDATFGGYMHSQDDGYDGRMASQ